MFGVILWFMLLGPTGAWLFRVTDLMRRRAVFEGARAREQTGATARLCAVRHSACTACSRGCRRRLLAIGYALCGELRGRRVGLARLLPALLQSISSR